MKKLIFLILALLTCVSTTACGNVKDKKPEESAQVTSVATAFSSGPVYDYESNTITKTVTATLYPETTFNKKVDYYLDWAEGSTQISENVFDYVDVVQLEDGSLTANVICKQPFTSKIVLTCVPRSNKYVSASCDVTYLGLATTFTATSNAEHIEGTDIYKLTKGELAEITLNADSFFGNPKLSLTFDLLVQGQAWFYYYNNGLEEIRKEDISAFKTSVTGMNWWTITPGLTANLEENKVTFTARKTIDELKVMEMGFVENPNVYYEFIGDTFPHSNLDVDQKYYNENLSAIANNELYYELRIYEGNSGLKTSIKFVIA